MICHHPSHAEIITSPIAAPKSTILTNSTFPFLAGSSLNPPTIENDHNPIPISLGS